MAKVLGFEPENKKVYDLEQKIKMQEGLIEELLKLNQSYEEEVRRLVGEYDKLYIKYSATQNLTI